MKEAYMTIICEYGMIHYSEDEWAFFVELNKCFDENN